MSQLDTAKTPHASLMCTECGYYIHDTAAHVADHTPDWELIECIESPGGGEKCGGDKPEYRFGYGLKGSYVRCGKHFDAYMARAKASRRRYPDSDLAPTDFDPTYAGERWDEDY